jgi:O-antigen/teichoic acid export membrane protein
MSRLKRLAHSLLSGYVLLGVNMVFTLAGVPLALHYLSTAEYGLWSLMAPIASYIALMDFGLNAATSRILIDYKDHAERGKYGSVIQTDVLVGLAQAGLIFIVGIILAFAIGPVLDIPAQLQPQLFWLVIGQCCISAGLFVTRVIAHVLTAHQRFDVINYSGAVGLVANLGVMWWGFAHGLGVFSMMWGQAASMFISMALNWIGGFRLNLFPRRGQWGRPSWAMFHELFSFGRDYFLFALGTQFVNASQAMLLTRLIGLDAAALWNIYTRVYLLLVQVITQIFHFSSSALAEMMVQGDRGRLLQRFREITGLCVNLAVAAGAIFAVDNSAFVHVWKAGKVFSVPWLPWNDLLLAVWLVICIAVRVHIGLIGLNKAFHFMRFIYFVEGLVFIGLTILLHQFGGITIMLVISIVCSLCFTFPYSLWRTREYFHLSWRALAGWHRDTLMLAITVAPVCALVWWLSRNLPALQRLAVNSVVAGIWTACMFLRYGLGASLRAEASRRAPAWARPILSLVGFAKSEI